MCHLVSLQFVSIWRAVWNACIIWSEEFLCPSSTFNITILFCQELWSFWDVTSLAELCTYTYEFCRNTRHWVKENSFLLILITRSVARIKIKNWSLTSRLAAKQWELIKSFKVGGKLHPINKEWRAMHFVHL